MNWLIQTSEPGENPIVVSEYLLNDLGVFIRREYRMPKNDPLTVITGFRVGYEHIPNTDYRMAPKDRNAILWHKITSISDDQKNMLVINGNTKDVIILEFLPENRDKVISFINQKRLEHPAIAEADPVAAAWMCWRDDDEWEDNMMSLEDMVNNEIGSKRFIEDYILEETIIEVIPENKEQKSMISTSINKYCTKCGALLSVGGNFCSNCGNRIV